MVLAAVDLDDEPVIGLRAGSDADDAQCGKIMGLASAAGVYVSRLPFARGHITSLASLARQGRRRIVAGEDGEIVGFVDFRVPSGHVRNIFVHPGRQREGIGSLLLTAAEETIGGDVTATVLAANVAKLAGRKPKVARKSRAKVSAPKGDGGKQESAA